MLKKTKKFALNFKILRFFLIPTILVSTPFFNKLQDSKAAIEFQWDQDSVYRRLKWFQKENRSKLRNTIYFFFRPSDRRTDLLKINLAIPKSFKSTLNREKISLCKVKKMMLFPLRWGQNYLIRLINQSLVTFPIMTII